MGRGSRLLRDICALIAIITFATTSMVWQTSQPASADTNGVVSGFVWYDDNANGSVDAGELRIAGLTVIATWPSPSSTTTQAATDVNGNFSMTLPPGTYTLSATTNQKPGVALPVGARYQGSMQVVITAGGNGVANLGMQPKGPAVTAKIEVVWPHGAAGEPQPVENAPLVNVSAMVFIENSNLSVGCDFSGTVRLWQTLNNNAARPVAVGVRRTSTDSGKSFPVWEFENVDVGASRDRLNKYYFFVTVEGGDPFPYTSTTNIWSHGADARTYFPTPDVPATISSTPSELDARIQVVWPHDEAGNSASVAQARYVNLTASLFQRGTLLSVPPEWTPTVRLYQSLNSAPGSLVAAGTRRLVTVGGITYPVWDFNNIAVDQATNASNKYFFAVLVDGAPTYPAIWSHGADGRTYFPRKDVPDNSCQ